MVGGPVGLARLKAHSWPCYALLVWRLPQLALAIAVAVAFGYLLAVKAAAVQFNAWLRLVMAVIYGWLVRILLIRWRLKVQFVQLMVGYGGSSRLAAFTAVHLRLKNLTFGSVLSNTGPVVTPVNVVPQLFV